MADDPDRDAPASFVLSFLEATKPFLRGTLSGLAVFLAVSTACAQSADPQALGAAQAVFDDALRLMTERRYDEACPKLKDVTRLVPSGVGAKLQLAKCYDEAGRLASAWGAYLVVANDARAAAQPERVKAALDRAAELRPRLSALRITVPASLRSAVGIEIRRDGVLVTEGQWGVAVPADHGTHTISVGAPGRKEWLSSVKLEGEATTVEVTLPQALEPLPAAELLPVAAPIPMPMPDTKPQQRSESAVPVWAWVSGGAGVALAGASIAFLIDERAVQSNIDAACPGGKACSEGFDASGENARLYRDFGLFIGLGVGSIVGLSAGIFGVATAPKRAASAALPTPWMSSQAAGLSWEGRF